MIMPPSDRMRRGHLERDVTEGNTTSRGAADVGIVR